MSKERCHVYLPEILPDCELTLAALLAKAGECISGRETTTGVYPLRVGQVDYYLKVCHREHFRKLLPRIFANRKWCSSVEIEAHTLRSLARRGFDAVRVVASGTGYKKGFPNRGFMLTEAVKGASLECVLNEDGVDSSDLWRDYGELSARLNEVGCYEPLRAKDILIENGRMILLDREKPILGGRGGNPARSLKSLERAIYRNKRSGLKMERAELRAFLAGYAVVRPDLVAFFEKKLARRALS